MSERDPEHEARLAAIQAIAVVAAGDIGPRLKTGVLRYFEASSPDALKERSAEDLAAGALAHLRLAVRRAPGTALVSVQAPRDPHSAGSAGFGCVQTCTDDMPFLVDTVMMAVRDAGAAVDWSVHPVLTVQREAEGTLVGLAQDGSGTQESWIHLEFEPLAQADAYPRLAESIRSRLEDLRVAVSDYAAMRARLHAMVERLHRVLPGSDAVELAEASDFLRWLDDGHFTFLACAETRLVSGSDGRARSVPQPDSGLGLARPGARFADIDALIAPREELDKYAESPRILVLTKAAQRATIHHPDFMDQVVVRALRADGTVEGIARFVGLYTSEVYHEPPWDIPLVRRKLDSVVQRSGLREDSHSGKYLREILNGLPRDELFQSSEDELFRMCMGIRALRDRHPLRLFLRRDRYGRFFSALVYLPRERYSRELRDRIGQELLAQCAGQSLDRPVTVEFLRGGLTRLHFVVHTAPGTELKQPAAEIETRLLALARPWREVLLAALRPLAGDAAPGLAARFGEAFASSHAERIGASAIAADVMHLSRLSAAQRLLPSLHLSAEGRSRLKLYTWSQPLPLADILPVLENFGVRAIRQDPEAVQPPAADGTPGETLWIQDFEVELPAGDRSTRVGTGGADRTRNFEAALLSVLASNLEDDALNRLVLAAGLTGRQVVCLRMLARYVNQIGLPYGRADIERMVAQHADVARSLVELFEARFDPGVSVVERKTREEAAAQALAAALDAVASLDADRVLRTLASVVRAGLRTNYFQTHEGGQPKSWLSLKIDPRQVPELPAPRPMFEIWVYAPNVEGVHLRGGRVARGGLRWSDRREDFRTEVLGLMKAQQVKNAIIVPVGAKGGFVVKQGPPASEREAWLASGIECYRTFLRGLLDLTDNRVGDGVVPPPQVLRHDDDDPYLVVAADKGTATFSDIANSLAQEYGFWLGDAFASGGSAGYDHKKMGITARGAWESVKRHFRELDWTDASGIAHEGKDIQTQPFTVVGIGDMSGDVFGNGMLLSRQIHLIAAFDHRHIFIDPEPDAAASFEERVRLFALPRSSWADYDAKLISAGGGIWPRTTKLIKLSPQARAALGTDREALSPSELMRTILLAPVDLFWNGGIGTYVKASHQSSEEVRDRANDSIRVDGRDLRVRVVGEGGNLGVTQAGRVEYARRGGRINTDAIDNSGGVHSSDREVNIKIPLNRLMLEGQLARPDRDALLASMTEDVAQAVLRDNYIQSGCISLVESEAVARIDEHAALIRRFEREVGLNRTLEALPDEEELQERRAEARGLTRPEIAVLVAWSKIALNEVAISSGLADDPFFLEDLLNYFPPALVQGHRSALEAHRLRREIVATIRANAVVNRMGVSFAHRLADEQSVSPATVLKAYTVADALFDGDSYWNAIEAMDGQAPASTQHRLMNQVVALLRHVSASLAGSKRIEEMPIAGIVARYTGAVPQLAALLPEILPPAYREDYERHLAGLRGISVAEALAMQLTRTKALGSALDIADLADASRVSLADAAALYFAIGERLRMPWLLSAIVALKVATLWQNLARAKLREDAYRLHRALAAQVLAFAEGAPLERLEAWSARHERRLRFSLNRLAELQTSGAADYAGLAVAVRELYDLQML